MKIRGNVGGLGAGLPTLFCPWHSTSKLSQIWTEDLIGNKLTLWNASNERQLFYFSFQDGNNFACTKPNCNLKFITELSLNSHIKISHLAPPRYNPNTARRIKSCHLCKNSKYMYTHSELRKHLARRHRCANFICNDCGKTFTRENLYRSHLQMHEFSKCHLCDKVFPTRQNANMHLVSKHKLKFEGKYWVYVKITIRLNILYT